MNTADEIDRLLQEGVRFNVTTGPYGFVVRLGSYPDEVTPATETRTLEEALFWLRAQAALSPAAGIGLR
jgi:hypothetical protein